jgi:hypothetical protein
VKARCWPLGWGWLVIYGEPGDPNYSTMLVGFEPFVPEPERWFAWRDLPSHLRR